MLVFLRECHYKGENKKSFDKAYCLWFLNYNFINLNVIIFHYYYYSFVIYIFLVFCSLWAIIHKTREKNNIKKKENSCMIKWERIMNKEGLPLNPRWFYSYYSLLPSFSQILTDTEPTSWSTGKLRGCILVRRFLRIIDQIRERKTRRTNIKSK